MMKDFRLRITFPFEYNSDSEANYIWQDFERVFGELESIAYKIDRDQIFMISRRSNIDDLYRDAALERLRHFRNRRVIVRDIQAGSIEWVIMIGAAAGVALATTLGKSTADGFRKTEFNKAFVDFVETSIDWLMLKWTDRLRSSSTFMRAKIERHKQEITIRLPPPDEKRDRLPTIGEFVEKIDKELD